MDDRERRPEIESQRRTNAILNSSCEQLPGPARKDAVKVSRLQSSRYGNEVIVRTKSAQ